MISTDNEFGTNAAKFQSFKADILVSKATPKVEYQECTPSPEQSHFEMLKSLELLRDDHFLLKDYCCKKKNTKDINDA